YPAVNLASDSSNADFAVVEAGRAFGVVLFLHLVQGFALGPEIAEPERRHLAHLDLLGAFRDAVAAVVAVDVLERLVARVAEAAMGLHRAVGCLAAQPVAPVIAHRDL